MPLIADINKDILAAHKAGNSAEVGTLRFLVAQIKNKEIEKRGTGSADPVTDEEAMDVLIKEGKKRKEAIDLYTKGNRADLADKEKAELEMLYRYIPRELSREDVEIEIGKLLQENPSREFSVLIKDAMQRLKGKTDGKVVSEVLKAKLGS